jgi:hypothetical protein
MAQMQLDQANGLHYEDRLRDIQSRVEDLGREIAQSRLGVVIERGLMTPTRTSHTVKLFNGNNSIAVVLTREEFLDEFGLFDRAAVPRLRTAIAKLRTA